MGTPEIFLQAYSITQCVITLRVLANLLYAHLFTSITCTYKYHALNDRPIQLPVVSSILYHWE